MPMSNEENWLDRFRQNLDTVDNPALYWLASPLLILGIVGILWSLPSPTQFYEISPLLNWGSAFLMAAAVYYFIISLSLAIGLLPLLLSLAAAHHWLASSAWPSMAVSTGLLAAGLTGIVLSRRRHMGRFLGDLQLLMIAPAWVLASIYRRINMPV